MWRVTFYRNDGSAMFGVAHDITLKPDGTYAVDYQYGLAKNTTPVKTAELDIILDRLYAMEDIESISITVVK